VLFERAQALHRAGELAAAAQLYREIVANDARHGGAHHFLGLVCMQLGDVRQAHELLMRAVELDPANVNALADVAALRVRLGRFAESLPLFSRVLEQDPNHADALNNMGNAYAGMQRPRDALALFERLTRIRPESAAARRRLADMHSRLGDLDAAIEQYAKAIELDPRDKVARLSLGDAYESLGKFKQAKMQYAAILRRDLDSPHALARALQLADESIDPAWVEHALTMSASEKTAQDGRIRLNVALGHYFDRRGEYDKAFSHLRVGNDIKSAKEPFDSAQFTDAVDALMTAFDRNYFAALPLQRGSPSPRPIFIVGMPRSGTTLTEQILASHSDVAAGGELSTILNLGRQVERVAGQPYPDGVRDLNPQQLQDFANRYLLRLAEVSSSASCVTDKLPFNFMHVGFIVTMFPNARIIHCRREPLDNCLSCYFTSFTEQIQFANDLRTLGSYYIDYSRLMAHWNAVLPGRMLELQYESLVGATQETIRRMLDYCGLEWQDACLQFHATDRGVRTPSRWQVRQPIYSRSVQRWRRYESHLQALRDTLRAGHLLPNE